MSRNFLFMQWSSRIFARTTKSHPNNSSNVELPKSPHEMDKIVERCSLAESLRPYTELMRLEKPIGSWLLFWPGAWAIGMACRVMEQPLNWRLLALFGIGAVVMRGAGCTINDLWDRDIDRHVERTRQRPLARNALTPLQAVTFVGVQLSAGLAILLCLNRTSILLGIISLLPVTIYPLMKRLTYWPQFILGLTFNWGVWMGWTAQMGEIHLTGIVPLYLAGICWTMVYDTIYALQDLQDDLKTNVKSTAIRFGKHVLKWLTAFASLSIGCFLWTGVANGLGKPYYLGIASAAAHLFWQLSTLRREDVKDCLYKFKSNRWLGGLVFAGILGDLFLAQYFSPNHAFYLN